MAKKIDIEQLESGSTFAFLSLSAEFENGANTAATEAHFRTLIAALSAGVGLDAKTYFNPTRQEFVTLPTLVGPPLFAAMYAFSKALVCEPFASAAREVLKEWVVGDAHAVGLAMVQLKWGADLKSSLPPDPSLCCAKVKNPARILYPAEEFGYPDEHETFAALRGDDPQKWAMALESLRKVAVFDGHRLGPFLPALTDGLAKECRDRILEVLTIAIQTGLDVKRMMPVLAGLLVDRDYYDAETVGRLYRCLIAAVEAGVDISMAWPYIGMCMEENGLKLKLLLCGAQSGLSILGHLNFLLSHLRFSIVPSPSVDRSELTCRLESAAVVLEILTLGVEHRDFSRLQLDEEIA